MKITSQSGLVPVTPMAHRTQTVAKTNTTKVEQTDVSNTAQLLARNQTELQNKLSPRDEIIQRFSGNLTDSVKLQDRTIDLIMQRMKNS